MKHHLFIVHLPKSQFPHKVHPAVRYFDRTKSKVKIPNKHTKKRIENYRLEISFFKEKADISLHDEIIKLNSHAK